MNEIEKGLRAIHRALLEQGKILTEIRDLLRDEVVFEEPTKRNTTEHDPKAFPAVRTFDPDDDGLNVK